MKTQSGRGKKFLIGGLVVLVIAAAVVVGIGVLVKRKQAADASRVAASQVVVFRSKGTYADFQKNEAEFESSVAFLGSFVEENVKIVKVAERKAEGYIYIHVEIGAYSRADLNAGVDAISRDVMSLKTFGVDDMYLDESSVPAPTAPGVTPIPTPAPTTAVPTFEPFALRINCGGTFDYVDGDGKVWLSDTDYTGGVAWKLIGKTGNTLYDTERFFQNLIDNEGYHISVPHNGQYAVNLTFVELTQTMPNARMFQPIIEGISPVGVIDIIFETNSTGIPMFVDAIVQVNDLRLDITLIKVKQNAKISAIEIIAL
jgi:hypothetical protein